jgi:hypothetical protein
MKIMRQAMNMNISKNTKARKGCVWVIPDGDLPPPGKGKLKGHESLVILNNGKKDARITVDIYFEDRVPDKNIKLKVGAERVKCFRLDSPIGEDKYQIPYGQYAMVVNSSVPVIVQFGRLDVRQANMAYYCTMAYPLGS